MRHHDPRIPTMALLLVTGMMAGCRGAHLYRQTEHDLASSAKTSFADAKLAESLQGERSLLDSMLAQELRAVRHHTLGRRNEELRAVLIATTPGDSWAFLKQRADSRVAVLAGDAAHARELVAKAAPLPTFAFELELLADNYRLARSATDPQLSCPAPAAPKPATGNAGQILTDYNQQCTDYLAAQKATLTAAKPGSAIHLLTSEIATAESDYSQLKTDIAALDRKYKQAKKDHAAATKARDASKVATASADMRKQLADLEALAGKNSGNLKDLGLAATVDVLEKRQESLDRVLEALAASGGDTDRVPPDSTRADLEVLRWIPALEKQINATRYPDVGALLLERENLRLRLDAAKRRQEHAEARLALMRAQRDAMITELQSSFKATQLLDAAVQPLPSGGGCDASKALADAHKAGATRCRDFIVRALVDHANAWTLGRTTQEEIEYRLIAARHAAVIDASENALAQWESLVKIPVDQLVTYHGSGTRTADIVALLSALGLGALAANASR